MRRRSYTAARLAGIPAPTPAVSQPVSPLGQAVAALRAAIAGLGGTTIVEHAPLAVKQAVDVWGPIRPDFRLMRALKEQFDPQGTLNPGRFVGGL